MNNSNNKKGHPASQRQKAPVQAPSRRKRSFLNKFLMSLGMTVLACIAVVSVGLALYINKIADTLPTDDEILAYRANEASIVYDRKGRVITELYVENRKPMKLEQFSKWMVMSILAAEDSQFYSHKGIRPLAILRSLFSGEGGQGASTITQQLARNLFLSSEKSLDRKAKEAIISLHMERLYSKDKLLETYLNAIYFGHGAWGIDAAAHSYFNKSASDLTLGEASILAGLVAAPEKYSPIRNMNLAKARQNYVLNRLVHLDWITREEADTAAQEQLKFNERTEKNKLVFNKAPYFVSHILFKELITVYGSDKIYKGGMKIYTTLDLDVQQAAEESMAKLKSEGGLVALDPADGSVLALVGGKDFEQSKFNRVTQAFRQSGSAFKPIVYTAALEAGYRPIDHIMDTPISLRVPNSSGPAWTPHNFSETYAGEETLLNALAHSHNTPAVRLTYMLGPTAVVETARRMGITSPYLTPTLSVGLGVASVTPLEMAVVYSVFANNGNRVEPYFIREIRSREGKVLQMNSPKITEALPPGTAMMARAMLQEVIRAGTGSKARLAGFEMFGKTGTTNDYTDAWFAGGVPGVVAVVYAGNDDPKPLGGKNATGSQIALPVWSSFIRSAVKILETPHVFPRELSDEESGVRVMRVCVESGFPASPECKKVTNIYMPADRIPAAPCPLHAEIAAEAEDPNAPQLLLLDQDKTDLDAAKKDEELLVSQDQLPILDPSQIPPPIPPAPDLPPSEGNSTGSWRDYIKKDDRSVEERYQELLKKYNIQ